MFMTIPKCSHKLPSYFHYCNSHMLIIIIHIPFKLYKNKSLLIYGNAIAQEIFLKLHYYIGWDCETTHTFYKEDNSSWISA